MDIDAVVPVRTNVFIDNGGLVPACGPGFRPLMHFTFERVVDMMDVAPYTSCILHTTITLLVLLADSPFQIDFRTSLPLRVDAEHLHGAQREGMRFYNDIIPNSGSCSHYPQMTIGKLTILDESIFYLSIYLLLWCEVSGHQMCLTVLDSWRVAVLLLQGPPPH